MGVLSSDMITVFPFMEARMPSIMKIRPHPPESTTPASFSTGSISGVFDRTTLPASSTSEKNSTGLSYSPQWDMANSLIPLATVSMVPSVGFMTAL